MSFNEDDLSLLEDDIEIEPISEAPGDENNAGGGDNVDLTANDDAGTDNPDQGDQNNADQNADNQDTADNNQDENNDNNQQTNNTTDQENDDNFDVNMDDDNPNDNGDNNNAPAEGENQEGDEEPEETEAEKEMNDQLDSIYDQLTPLEKQKRDEILRDHYKTLFNAVDLLINNTQDFPKTTDTIKMIKRLIRNLNDFKDYISYYFTTVYSTKSHLENLTRFRQFLQIYSGIASIYTDLDAALGHEFDKYGRNVEELEKMYSIED